MFPIPDAFGALALSALVASCAGPTHSGSEAEADVAEPTAAKTPAAPTPEAAPEPSTAPQAPPTADEVEEASPTAAAPAPCTNDALQTDGKWRGRGKADEWLPGIYRYEDVFEPSTIVLTFDDGPKRPNTDRILAALKKHDLKATFFVVGRAIKSSNYDLIRQMVDEGHSIGNHTYHHDASLPSRGGSKFNANYVRAEYEITQARVDLALIAQSPAHFKELDKKLMGRVGKRPTPEQLHHQFAPLLERHAEILQEHGYSLEHRPYRLLYSRPPGGSPYMGPWDDKVRERYAKVVNDLGMLTVMWNSTSGDSDSKLPPEIRLDHDRMMAKIKKGTFRGGIILVHDRIPSRTIEAAIDWMVKNPAVTVQHLDDMTAQKFGCAVDQIAELKVGEAPATLPPVEAPPTAARDSESEDAPT